MTFTSDAPLYVDGVRLDTLAWNIEKINRATAARREADVVVPGRDGVLPSLNDDLEPVSMGLEMFVQGTAVDGSVPYGRLTRMQENLDELVHLFGKRHALLEVAQAPPGTAWTRNEVWIPAPSVSNPGLGVWSGLAANGSWTASGVYANAANARPNDLVTVLTTLRNTGGADRSVSLRAQSALGGVFAGANASNPASTTVTVPAGQSVAVRHITRLGSNADSVRLYLIDNGGTPPANTLYVDTALLTFGSYTGPHFDGTTAADGTYTYAWTGTAHGSPSTKTPVNMRRAWAKVTDAITPDMGAAGSSGRFAVGLTLPYGVWEDYATQDFTKTPVSAGTAFEVTTLRGATERITDAVLLVLGPVTNPRLTDPATGAYVELQFALTAGQSWRLNVGTWATRTGSLGIGNTDLQGTDRQSVTRYGGMLNQSTFLPLTPTRQAPVIFSTGGPTRAVSLVLTGTGMSGATAVQVRARRKYAL